MSYQADNYTEMIGCNDIKYSAFEKNTLKVLTYIYQILFSTNFKSNFKITILLIFFSNSK